MDTFPIVRRKDEEKWGGDYRTKRVILEIYDALAESIRTGRPYQTRLDPPPADPRCCHPPREEKSGMSSIAILAYGSLISDPGTEIGPLITRRVPVTTPFPVEYARLSGTRGGAPTVVPHSTGCPVKAEVMVLLDSVSLAEAKSLLWRRETRNEGSGRTYQESTAPKAVLVRDEPGLCGLGHVLYTDFNPGDKLTDPDPEALGVAAINSVAGAAPGMDGISYLMDLISAGVATPLTRRYVDTILALTGAAGLPEALESLRTELTGGVRDG